MISAPAVVTALDAKGSPGTIVTYSVSATDAFDPSPALVCVPSSGSFFPRGTTLVTCTATDNWGNVSVATFQVIVHPSVRVR